MHIKPYSDISKNSKIILISYETSSVYSLSLYGIDLFFVF